MDEKRNTMTYKEFNAMLNCMFRLSGISTGLVVLIENCTPLPDKVLAEIESITAHARHLSMLIGEVVDDEV